MFWTRDGIAVAAFGPRAGQLRFVLAVGCASVFGAAPALARIEVPAIATPASTEHHKGKVVFGELITPDMVAAKTFYGSLFGWSFRDVPGGHLPYSEAYLDGAAVAALVEKPVPAGEHRQSAWLNFFSAPDVDAAVKLATAHGGKVLVQPHVLPDRGREAVLTDPEGAVFALLTSQTGDPPDSLKPVGDWIWHSVLARDTAAAGDFYKTLLGYEVLPLPAPAGEQHLLLATEDYARASVNSLPTDRPDDHSRWLAFVRVDDAAKAAAKVASLGGHVVVAPEMDRHGGMIAVVTDPLGAPFGLFEWSPNDTKQVGK